MLTGKIKVFGKTIPVWIAGLALVAATAGAATGVVLAGSVKGEIVTTVSQSLLVRKVSSDADASFNAISDDGTRFTAAVEMLQSDKVTISVAAVNKTADVMGVLIRLDLLPGVTADIDGVDGALIGSVDTCVRVSLTDWKCKLAASEDNDTADFEIELALNDEIPPGFYTHTVTMTQIENKS